MGGSLALCLEAMVRMWASGAIVYMGGDDSDTITAGTNFGYEGDVLLQMGDGNNSLHVGTGPPTRGPLSLFRTLAHAGWLAGLAPAAAPSLRPQTRCSAPAGQDDRFHRHFHPRHGLTPHSGSTLMSGASLSDEENDLIVVDHFEM